MENIKTIGVLTSGGDAPGMNPCIRAVVRTALDKKLNVLGIYGGYEGLLNGSFRPLGARDVGGILQRGGTILQTARSNNFQTIPGRMKALREMNSAGVDALVVIGGDGSLRGALSLMQEGFPVVGIPASIDNDIYGTDMCIGVDTALNTIVDAIDKLRDTATSHNRAFLIETMGRKNGYLAQHAGIVSGAEMVLIPEIPVEIESVIKAVENAYIRGKTHCIIVVAEGFEPNTTVIAERIAAMKIGFDTRVTILGHIQRGGKPTAFDRMLATRYGAHATRLLVEGKTGIMTALQGREINPISLEEATSNKKALSEEYFNLATMLAR
ncbi:MAG: 6-phosphofructokinase [Chloroflexi bacterium]|nr:6-phosphofructokinase [Chloroflexota bacterium]